MEYLRLKDVCDINMGQSPTSDSYNDDGDGVPFFQGNADFGDRYPVTRKWCNAPTKMAQPGDILISVRAPIGAINYAKEECCIGRGLAAVTPDRDKVSPDFVFWFLKGKKEELNSKGTGSTFKAISRKVLEEILVPNVDLKEQSKYAEILEKIYFVQKSQKQELKYLDDLIKARFVEMFGDVIHNDRKWECKQFSDITTSRLGKMLDTKHQTGTCKYPYLANFNVQWFRFELGNLNEMDFNEKEREEFCLEDGDLLVCEGGEIGRCAVWHNQIRKCFFQKALHRVRCNQDIILPDYLSWWFKYNCENGGFTAIEGAKATISHLTGTKMKMLDVTVPPIELQEQFVDIIHQVDKSKSAKAMKEFNCHIIYYMLHFIQNDFNKNNLNEM